MADYTSNVLITLSESAYKQFRNKLSAVKKPETKKRLHELLAEAEILMQKKTHEVLLKFIGVQWEAYDPDVEPAVYFIDSFLNSLSPDEYHYIRSGEQLNDIEIYGTLNSKFAETVSLRVSYRKSNSTVIKLG